MTIFAALTAPVLQTSEWQCSAATLAWMLTSIGQTTSQDEAVALLGPSRISPELGLLDATGAGLVEVLHQVGLDAHNTGVGYDDVLSIAGSAPIGIGGHTFYHWVGVRGADGDDLLLANPSPGYKGIGQRMSRGDFANLGPFYAVVIDNTTLAGNDVGSSAGQGPPWLLIGIGAALLVLLGRR